MQIHSAPFPGKPERDSHRRVGKFTQQKSAAEIRRQKSFPASNLTRRLVVYSHLDCLRLLDLSESLFNFMLLIFQKHERTNVLLISIVSGRRGDFNSLFRKTHHHFLWSLMNFQVGKRPDMRSPYSLFMRRRFCTSKPALVSSRFSHYNRIASKFLQSFAISEGHR